MSKEVCFGLNLLFDPTIQLNMQSANGEVDRSLGLIRNVPFHIAYDILLGRPFDVLTQSVVKNFADENQTITILCPNTGETVTIPTSYHFWSPPRGDFRQEFAAFGFPKMSPVVTRSQVREAASRSAAENLDSSSRTQSTPSPTIPGDFDRDEEDEIDQELQDDFDEEPIPSTAEERTSSPELLGLTTSDYDFLTPDLFERSSSSPEPEDPIPATSNLVLPTPSSFRAHAQPPIASSSRLSVIPSSDLAPPPLLAPSNAASNSNPAPPAPTIPSTTTSSSLSPAPINTTNMSQNTNTPLMPPRGHSTAPSFDPSEVRSLQRYFQDLEALFTRCQITDEAAKKQWAIRYPSIDVADLWETIESFIDVAKSYNDWKADVRALYPGTDDTRKWSLADMDQLIGECARIGIHNAADLGCYYRDFMAITKHLIAQHRLSTIEQTLLTRLETRLHLKHPDHYADDPYTMAEIHAAATFILHGTSSTPTTAANQATASTSNTSTTVAPGMIKTEDISMIIESLSRTIATLIQPTTHATHNHAPAPRQQAAVHIHENSGVEQTCHYCGNHGCRVGTCEFAEIDIRDGKCKHNTEGKIVLPNGSFCPRTIPGLTIRDRIYKWHRRNPAAPAAPTMLFEIDDRSTMQTFTLNTSSRIEALERELLQLRKRREVFDGVEILQRKKPTTPVVTRSAEASGSGTSKGVAAPSSTSTSTAPPPTIPAATPAPSSFSPTQSTSHPITMSAPPAPPVHPFANARDTTYAPPNVRNFATPPKPSNDKGKEPAYKTIVPVIQPKLAEEIFQRSMKSQFVTLTPEELLSIAPDVRTKYRDAITPKRVSTEPVASAHIIEIGADKLGPTGPANVEDLLDLSGALLSCLPCGEGLQLDLAVYAGGDAAQVPIPRAIRRTLEQRGKFRSELRQLHLCCRLIVEISEAGLEGGGKGRFVPEWGGSPLYSYLHRHKLGKVGGGPGAGITVEQAQRNLYFELDGVDAQLRQEPVAINDGFAIVSEWEEEL
ncbi:predicted protein [Postia placenta Mad-698-R]|nr:predicted protein [Postia placenta Mad-698-R]